MLLARQVLLFLGFKDLWGRKGGLELVMMCKSVRKKGRTFGSLSWTELRSMQKKSVVIVIVNTFFS